MLSGSQLVFDPLYTESVGQANQVKQFLNENINGHDNCKPRAITPAAVMNASCHSSILARTNPRSGGRPLTNTSRVLDSRPSSREKVKQIFTSKLQAGVAVNPLYAGVL